MFACGQRGCNRCQALAASSPLSWGSPLSPWKWFYKENIPSRKLESHLILSHSFFNFLKIQLSVLYCNLKYNCFLTFLHRFSLIHFEELFQDLFFFLKIVENFRQILRDSLCFSDRLFQASCKKGKLNILILIYDYLPIIMSLKFCFSPRSPSSILSVAAFPFT